LTSQNGETTERGDLVEIDLFALQTGGAGAARRNVTACGRGDVALVPYSSAGAVLRGRCSQSGKRRSAPICFLLQSSFAV